MRGGARPGGKEVRAPGTHLRVRLGPAHAAHPGQDLPTGDQHAGHELGRDGKPICARLGLAADFLVRGVDSREAALWIVENTSFDRLYFYKPDQPIHVSVGPETTRQIVYMRGAASGRLVPRVVLPGFFRER